MEKESLIEDNEYHQINQLYDECLKYLENIKNDENVDKTFNENDVIESQEEHDYETIKTPELNHNIEEAETTSSSQEEITSDDQILNNKVSKHQGKTKKHDYKANSEELQTEDEETIEDPLNFIETEYKVENERIKELKSESKSDRLRRLSQQLPKIIITQSSSSLNVKDEERIMKKDNYWMKGEEKIVKAAVNREYFGDTKRAKRPGSGLNGMASMSSRRGGYGEFPRRLVSKSGVENVALISNVPFEKIRLLNDTFHTLINLRWRWIVMGTVVVHFTIWLVFAVFWYIAALAHYDFSPNPPARSCVTGGKDFVTIFLASVEAQTTIGFGDRAIDEECPESIFLFIMQLILGTGLSGVLTCVVYAKLTRPEKLSRDGVGFSKKAVISMRDGQLCLMMRAWDLNYDHIISSEFSAHFVNTHRTKEGEMIRYFATNLPLQQRQFLLWPVTLVHVIDDASPLYRYTPDSVTNNCYEITVSLKGASASMGTFTQSQTSYTPRELVWGHRFPPVVKYDSRKQKYVIEHKKLDATEPIETPLCSASELYSTIKQSPPAPPPPETPSVFSEKISGFVLERSSSFRHKSSSKPTTPMPTRPTTPMPTRPTTPMPTRPTTPNNFSEKISGFVLERSSSIRSKK